jgi:hypothetical protein
MNKVKKALLSMPVSVNCYYGDPTLQWDDTMRKLRALAEVGHIGPVSIITKGSIGPTRAQELASLKLPGLIAMVSISELPKGFEKVGHDHRYKTIENCRKAGIKVFAAVRPLIPPYNTSEEVVNRIFTRLQAVGCEVACVSGFRGDASLIEEVNPDTAIQWTLRVKQMTGFDQVLRIAKENGVQLFTRVNCAVSYLTGRDKPFNPYWGSPQLVRCKEIECPLRGTCGPVEPDEEVLSWLRQVGYDVEYQPAVRQLCGFQADNRLDCKSCCTTCFVQKQPRVLVRNAKTLGDLTFCRFVLGGTLCVFPGMIDGGDKDVGHVTQVQEQTGLSVHCINSWFVWANQLENCFGCKYCVSGLYPNKGPVGCPPVELLNFFSEGGEK